MASKIDIPIPVPAASAPPVSRASSKAGGSDPGAAPAAVPASDSLKLSGEASGLVSAQRELSASPPSMDQTKIDALRAAISAGTYQINPREIAVRLAALERKLA